MPEITAARHYIQYYDWPSKAPRLYLTFLDWHSIKRLSSQQWWTAPACSRVVVSETWQSSCVLSTGRLHCTPQRSASSTCVIQQLRDSHRQCDYVCSQSHTHTHTLITVHVTIIRRSQRSSGSMPDCSARGPGIESCCGQLCWSHNHCDLQPWARAVRTLPAMPRSTQPSTLRGTVNDYQLSG